MQLPRLIIKNLKIAQNIWIKFRDAEMNMKYPQKEPGYYGSVFPTCWNIYMAELPQKRSKELKRWLTGIAILIKVGMVKRL
jgi:uncharacterized protein YecT (DUF1311 family)